MAANGKPLSTRMRIWHRYLGYFLAGIMAIYALSGMVLIFRDTNAFKREKKYSKTIEKNLNEESLARAIRVRALKFEKVTADTSFFKDGWYHPASGKVAYTAYELPVAMQKLTQLHKASTRQPLYWLNLFFGASLFFFVISSFFMFAPKSKIFTKALYYTVGGAVLTLLLLFFS